MGKVNTRPRRWTSAPLQTVQVTSTTLSLRILGDDNVAGTGQHTTASSCQAPRPLYPLKPLSYLSPQRYKFIIRPEANWDGVAYCCSFDTQPGQWQTIRLPFRDFFPVFRARRMAPGSVQPLDPASISSIQVGKLDIYGISNVERKTGGCR